MCGGFGSAMRVKYDFSIVASRSPGLKQILRKSFLSGRCKVLIIERVYMVRSVGKWCAPAELASEGVREFDTSKDRRTSRDLVLAAQTVVGRLPTNLMEKIMRVIQTAILAVLLGASSLLFAAEGEFNKECAMGLAMGQHFPTDCSVNWTNPADGKTYCFSSTQTRDMFLNAPTVNLKKAQAEFGRR